MSLANSLLVEPFRLHVTNCPVVALALARFALGEMANATIREDEDEHRRDDIPARTGELPDLVQLTTSIESTTGGHAL